MSTLSASIHCILKHAVAGKKYAEDQEYQSKIKNIQNATRVHSMSAGCHTTECLLMHSSDGAQQGAITAQQSTAEHSKAQQTTAQHSTASPVNILCVPTTDLIRRGFKMGPF